MLVLTYASVGVSLYEMHGVNMRCATTRLGSQSGSPNTSIGQTMLVVFSLLLTGYRAKASYHGGLIGFRPSGHGMHARLGELGGDANENRAIQC